MRVHSSAVRTRPRRPTSPGPSLRSAACFGLALLCAQANLALGEGISSTRSQLLFETAANPDHLPWTGDELGHAVAAGDFDFDGVQDLAIGIPFDDPVDFGLDVGQVQIRFGVRDRGLEAGVFVKYIWQGGLVPLNAPGEFDYFGSTLAVGDFDGDGIDDLAIGTPGEDISGQTDAGGIDIRYGALNRSDALETRRQFFSQNSSGVPDTAASDDEFGHALAAGDFNGDGKDDLAVGVPFDAVAGQNNAGIVIVLPGSAAGLVTSGAQLISIATLGFHSPGAEDRFGWAIAAADFDANGFADLAIGEPMTTPWGLVFVMSGTASGLTSSGAIQLNQGSGGMADTPEPGDAFGYSLAVGNFDGAPFPDLVIGVPGEALSIPEVPGAGAVHVLFGSASGLSGIGSQFWTQMTPGIPGGPEVDDHFGFAVAAGDFNHDHFDELVIGIPNEGNFVAAGEGDVLVLAGGPGGPTTTDARTWNLQVPGIPGDMNPGDHLGWSLAIGDFDDDLHADLVAGSPGDASIGGVMVLYGALFADNFETGTTALWSAAVP